MSRRPSIEPFLRPAPPPPTKPAKPSKLFLLASLISLSLLWCAFLYLPIRNNHTHHLTTPRTNATLLPYAINTLGNWTLPLPSHPLTPSAMLTTCDAVHHHSHKHHPYYWTDPTFVDPTASFPRSLAFSLASPANFPQGLAESLLELFTAYALAQHESRTFTIDDRDWPWGAWEDYFLPLSPTGGNIRTTPLPCPRSANALSISHSTRTFVFGHAFTDSFELPRFAGSARQKRIFDLASTGLTALWRLQPQLQALVDSRVNTLTELGGAGAWTAVHIRRGDFRPQTWAWHKRGIPLEVFVDPAVSLSKGEGRVVVVSDDPMVPEAPELAGAYRASDVGVGIQGGWGKKGFVGLSAEERRRVGEEFLVQMEVVRRLVSLGGNGEGGAVCAAGSSTCRLLAVMVGWEKAVGKERWWDVEGGLGWRGVDW